MLTALGFTVAQAPEAGSARRSRPHPHRSRDARTEQLGTDHRCGRDGPPDWQLL